MVNDLPTPPILQKEAFLAENGGRLRSTFFCPQKKEVDLKMAPLDGGKDMIYLALF